MNWKALVLIGLILIAGLFLYFKKSSSPSLETAITEISPTKSADNSQDNKNAKVSIIASNLNVPWAIAFLPDGNLLVTERAGTVKLVSKTNGTVKEVGKINVRQVSESGLHGIAVDPSFSQNKYIYLYYTYASADQNTLNRVSRFVFDNNLSNEKIIVDQIPGAPNHDGGRIKFGPDKNLYITTGDAQNPSLSQDKNSLAGKILKVLTDGKVEVYSSGHRNPQGITWDGNNRIWETEHGQSATDELNLIEQGKNYGWPTIRGDQKDNQFQSPIIHSGSDTWAPSGTAYLDGVIYFAGLRGNALFAFNIKDKKIQTYFKGEFGRLREVVVGPDNLLYITTSNRDGRGIPKSDDDKIIRIDPGQL